MELQVAWSVCYFHEPWKMAKLVELPFRSWLIWAQNTTHYLGQDSA